MVHELRPVPTPYVPAAHGVHAVAPAALYVPFAHSEQVVADERA